MGGVETTTMAEGENGRRGGYTLETAHTRRRNKLAEAQSSGQQQRQLALGQEKDP